ncbi:polysaccharide biosynthesis/export family protein [Alkalimonas sp. MEB108]|uniref:Polysaccharide biosynthesis/export family protein n=1 Tax=Alkalimonas cellulosilytica TaxID=3058395 RepID=A0ABU7J4W1_9GAMM|nr:polysaccharide biosynthesis/export family protein [Alkalimonas sp. MEB108]MEE2001543.1 polysaccharide biosynthesis/export family protein [Alkalimonas sp. MEB108]
MKRISMRQGRLLATALFGLLCCASTALANPFTDQSQQTQAQQARAMQAQQQAALQEPRSNVNWQQGGYGPIPTMEQGIVRDMRPFGAELFSGGFRGTRADGLNPDYRILPGDQVTLRVWGAVDIDRILPVDAQGNIFIPSIGPVQVQGVSHSQLDTIVRNAVRKVYPDNVYVYTNLQGVQPVAVFVTGFVNKPGRYAGVPSDSVLYFLDQASGIDEEQGSYRRIRLLRNGETLAEMDLYDFLLEGKLNHAQLQNGDTILVERRGPQIAVHGEVGRAYFYELNDDVLYGKTLMQLAQLDAGVSHALVRGQRASGPYANYQPLEPFAELAIANGDEVVFVADRHADTIVVQLEGSYYGPSFFILPKNATLHQLLDNIPVDQVIAETRSISIRRVSVAERQRESLLESLRRLETTYLGASSATVEESAIRVREAELISAFVARAREVEPNGRLVVSHRDQLLDLRLQDGDVITIPERSDSILVSGEVYIPQASIFVPGMSAWNYIEAAGGFSQHADKRRILIVRQNGEVRNARDVELRPGDEILVLPAVTTKNLQLASTLTQIIYQIAIAAKVAIDI